jgi:hypothetical protein
MIFIIIQNIITSPELGLDGGRILISTTSESVNPIIFGGRDKREVVDPHPVVTLMSPDKILTEHLKGITFVLVGKFDIFFVGKMLLGQVVDSVAKGINRQNGRLSVFDIEKFPDILDLILEWLK